MHMSICLPSQVSNEFDSQHVPFMYIDHLQFDLNFVWLCSFIHASVYKNAFNFLASCARGYAKIVNLV